MLNTTRRYLADCDGNVTLISFVLGGDAASIDVPIWVHGPELDAPANTQVSRGNLYSIPLAGLIRNPLTATAAPMSNSMNATPAGPGVVNMSAELVDALPSNSLYTL